MLDEALEGALRAAIEGIVIEQLETMFPADDDGLWYVRHPTLDGLVQLESPTGRSRWLIESTIDDRRWTASSVHEAVTIVAALILGAAAPDV